MSQTDFADSTCVPSSTGTSPDIETKPDPTFLKNNDSNLKKQYRDLKKPLGLAIEKRQQTMENENRGPRLSRQELETLLDVFYADNATEAPVTPDNQLHAQVAGRRMVRNLAFASCFALLAGFGLGLFSLSQQGGETPLGQKFNQALAGLWQPVRPTKTGKPTSQSKPNTKQANGLAIKPIKTASLMVADATGTIHAGIPLKLSLKSDSNIALVEVKIMNVPGDAVLTAGKRRTDGVWILQPDDLADVALVMSSDRQTPLRLDVELVEAKTGQLLSPIREIKVAIVPPKPFKIGGL